MQEGINKLIDRIEGVHKHQFTSEKYMNLYTTSYNICQIDQFGPEAQKLYEQYKKTFEDYITSKVLPSLRGKKDESLLEELVNRWNNHKVMTRWIARFFGYLNRYFVYGEINDHVRDAVISMPYVPTI
ncbi:hypothetical protein F0562_000237 [Nyssa sinensis]|uniref:Cullin N-terminal domain-containing protein n=1 Tax=Nyssa sinensis TaxID=561372 RepID=A0A5J5C0S0_9ASTE|nr:hypothetical protein F0562_000237 [Nyssa sinensis]